MKLLWKWFGLLRKVTSTPIFCAVSPPRAESMNGTAASKGWRWLPFILFVRERTPTNYSKGKSLTQPLTGRGAAVRVRIFFLLIVGESVQAAACIPNCIRSPAHHQSFLSKSSHIKFFIFIKTLTKSLRQLFYLGT